MDEPADAPRRNRAPQRIRVELPAPSPEGPVGRVALVTIDRPEVLNAIDTETLRQLVEAMERLEAWAFHRGDTLPARRSRTEGCGMTDEGIGRSLEQEPEGALRDQAPDPLAPIDPDSPVSGHVLPPPPAASSVDSPEHDWTAARPNIYPVLRPSGTHGQAADEPIDPSSGHAHTQPLVSPGPCDLVVAYALAGPGFDILVNGDHLLSWGIGPDELAETARANLAAWSERAGWSDEISGQRRILSSDNGDGHDAARILLPAARQSLCRELASEDADGTRVLVGLPERDLLIAGALLPDDAEFAALFRDFVIEHSGEAEEPIDRRVFELVDGELIEFAV